MKGDLVISHRDGSRKLISLFDPTHFKLMADIAKPLTDEEILALATYVQGLHTRVPDTAQAAAKH